MMTACDAGHYVREETNDEEACRLGRADDEEAITKAIAGDD